MTTRDEMNALADREAILKAICKADCFRWRILQEDNACAGPCQANTLQLEIRHGNAASNVQSALRAHASLIPDTEPNHG